MGPRFLFILFHVEIYAAMVTVLTVGLLLIPKGK